jgi:hypothetical protein
MTAVCVSNVSQIQKALQMYLLASDDRMPYDTGTLRDTWPSFVDPYLGGSEFVGPTDTKRPNQSGMWGACPNSKGYPFPNFRDGNYAGIFKSTSRWFRGSVAAVSDPSQSAIITEGNHESAANPRTGNSWLRVGTGINETEYDNITGISWNHVRHEFGTVFTLSMFDGSAKSIKWQNLNTFSSGYGSWVEDY